MKKMATIVMALVFCFSLVYRAEAIEHSKRKSLDIQMVNGRYNATTAVNGVITSKDLVSATGADLSWRFHKRLLGLSWGPMVSYRSISAPTGKLSFIGVGGSVGYVSNTFEDKKRWPIGWHTHLGVGVGKMSQLNSAVTNSVASFGSWNFGLDCKLRGWDSSESGKYKSALVATFDYGTDMVSVRFTTKSTPKLNGAMAAIGWVPKVGLSYYW